MADEIKWIKLSTGILDDEKIIAIEDLPDGPSLCWMWIKLLALAGRQNNEGRISLTEEIPYTDTQLAKRFRMPIATVQLGLTIFQQYKMIEIIDNFIYTSNWAKYQSLEGLEDIKEQTRKRVQRYREKQKQKLNGSTDTRTLQKLPEEIAVPALPEKVIITIPLIPKDGSYEVTESEYQKYQELFPAVDVLQELRKMVGWCDANPKNRKTKMGIKRFINSWLSRSQDKAPRKDQNPVQRKSIFEDA